MSAASDPHAEERRALALAAKAEQELRDRGVYLPEFDGRDTKLIQDILKAGAIAKVTSRQEVAVKVMRNGKYEYLVEAVGNEDIIYQALVLEALQQARERR